MGTRSVPWRHYHSPSAGRYSESSCCGDSAAVTILHCTGPHTGYFSHCLWADVSAPCHFLWFRPWNTLCLLYDRISAPAVMGRSWCVAILTGPARGYASPLPHRLHIPGRRPGRCLPTWWAAWVLFSIPARLYVAAACRPEYRCHLHTCEWCRYCSTCDAMSLYSRW